MLADPAFEQIGEFVGVLFFLHQDVFEHAARGRIVAVDPGDQLAIAVDRDALGDRILLHHVAQVPAFLVFGMSAGGERIGVEIGFAAELHDAFGDALGVRLFLLRAFDEFRLHRRRPACRTP